MGNRVEMRKASGKWDFVRKLHGQRQVGTHGTWGDLRLIVVLFMNKARKTWKECKNGLSTQPDIAVQLMLQVVKDQLNVPSACMGNFIAMT